MNRQEQTKTIFHRSSIIKRLLVQYVFVLLAYFGVLLAGVFIAYVIFSQRVWHTYDNGWYALHWLQNNINMVILVVFFAGALIITVIFAGRVLYYLGQVVNASGQIAVNKNVPIRLPSLLKNVQDELNGIREQSIKSDEQTKEAEKRKNDLIVYLAHDLKTPLTSVIGYLTLLRDEPQISTELRSKYTGIALSKAERLESLINEFFDITRFNLSAMTLDLEKISLNLMIEQIVSEFLPILEEKDMNIAAEVEPDMSLVCDIDKMERVFDNLIRNAVNYGYSSSVIHLTAQNVEGSIIIRIRNHGKTIAKEKLDKIFDQFFRLDSSRASVSGGAGLGLAISKEIVELHGGRITVESGNEMIQFTVILPIHI